MSEPIVAELADPVPLPFSLDFEVSHLATAALRRADVKIAAANFPPLRDELETSLVAVQLLILSLYEIRGELIENAAKGVSHE